MNHCQFLYKLLLDITAKSDSNFSGLGLLIYDNLQHLPISPLKSIDKQINLPIDNYDKLVNTLASISSSKSKYHDGFHLINRNLELTHLSQYVSPPIIENINIENEYGSRYRTALYSSKISNIICSGVVSVNYPITIFQNGKKIIQR